MNAITLTDTKLNSATSKVAPVLDQALFLLKTTVIISATVLLVASAWI